MAGPCHRDAVDPGWQDRLVSNFELLRAEWPELFEEAVRAEREAFTDPRISCFYGRRTLELAVAWL